MANILVVDDDEVIIKSVSAALTKAGHTVVCAFDGHSAIDTASRELFDLVITDINMPAGVSGFNVAATLRKMEQYEKTPVMFITGRRDKNDVLKAMQSGVDDYLMKPLDFDMLLAKVEALLQATPGVHAFQGLKIQSEAIWTINLKVESVSEQGFSMVGPAALPTNSKFKINCSIFDDIGIEPPLLRVASCTRIPKEDGFLLRAHFIGLDVTEYQKIRLWLRDNRPKKVGVA